MEPSLFTTKATKTFPWILFFRASSGYFKFVDTYSFSLVSPPGNCGICSATSKIMPSSGASSVPVGTISLKGMPSYVSCPVPKPLYNPQIQIFAESETKRPKFGLWNKTKRSKKRTSAQHKNAAFRAAFSLVFAKYSNVLIIVFKGLGSLSQNHAACQLCPLYNIMSVYPAL